MLLNQAALVLIGLLLAAWTLAAGVAILAARARVQRAESSRRNAQRLARMIEESPAIPLLVRSDGRIEAPERLADWLGLERVPQYLSELDTGSQGFGAADLAELTEAVRRTQKTAAPFRMVATPRGAHHALALRGHLADPQVSPGGSALVWVFETSDSDSLAAAMRRQAEREASEPSALMLLIEASPAPMWIRAASGELRFVNSAFALAVGAANADEVVERQMELVEPVDGVTAQDVCARAAVQGQPVERHISATVRGQRRALRVTDVPLGDLGTAGFAVDIEEAEELARTFRASREAQRAILDDLSAGIAQFDARRQLTFANKPFQRIFALDAALIESAPGFERILEAARVSGRLPELRDFPDWRREKVGWFAAQEPQEEAWPLSSGLHLRVVAQPQPDGGLVLIVEDRTEQLRLSAVRDTMLRTRTATLDSLFESVALFASDGRLDQWNRRFASDWGLESDYLDTHPHIQALIRKIAARLKRPAEADLVGEAVRSATLDRRETGGRVQLADGRTLAYAGVPLPDGSGLLIVLDMTDAQKAEEALRQRNEALQEADAVKARFLAELGHEFQHPLSVIGGFAERMRDGLGGDLNEVGKDYVAAILKSADRIGVHIDQLLALSRSEAGVVPVTREDIDLFAFAKQLANERKAAIRKAGLTLDLRGSGASGRVSGDRERLARAIGTLLDTAIAATPSGGRILFDVSRQKGPGGGRARIVVSDNGPGMDETTLGQAISGKRILSDGTLASGGPEQGLPLAQVLIEAHGGSLELLSEPGHGTAAIVELP